MTTFTIAMTVILGVALVWFALDVVVLFFKAFADLFTFK